jgi:DNA gyrase/topoisomerase IV subunit B
VPVAEPSSPAMAVVQTVVMYSLAEAISGQARNVWVSLQGDRFSVRDDGRGHSAERTVGDLPYLEFIYSQLQPSLFKLPGTEVQLHGAGMSLVNALCTNLTVRAARNGFIDIRFYRNAVLERRERMAGNAEESGNTVSGQLSASIVEGGVSEHHLATWLRAMFASVRSTRAYLNDVQVSARTSEA